MPNTVISTNNLPLDNTIKAVDGHYEADNGIVKSSYYQTGNRVVFEKNGRQFSWTPQEMKYVDSWGMEDVIYTVQDVPLETKANYARFNRSMPDVDDWFIMGNSELKHQILVQGFQRDPLEFMETPIDFCIGGRIEYDADLRIIADGTEQLEAFETSGQIWFMDDNNEVVFNLPAVVAYDSKIPERAMTGGKYRVSTVGDGVLSFQFVLDNAWISSEERHYPIVIDPTVVVNSAYDTSGNGGRKLVQLSNGWLVAGAVDRLTATDIVRLYKSTDNGVTWVPFCYIQDSTGYDNSNFSLASKDTTVYVVTVILNASPDITSYSINALTQTNVNIENNKVLVDSNQNAINSVSLMIDNSGNLHAAWESKNTTYPNSFNIRYSKSTDGGSTWAAPTQVTSYNSSFNSNTNPCIVIKADNNPIIIFQRTANSPTDNYISYAIFNGSTWDYSNTNNIYLGSSYTQSNPSAVVDSAGTIHVVWHGTDSSSSQNNIRYSKSTNGGSTWSSMAKLTSDTVNTQTSPTIAVDKNNKLYVFFYGVDPTITNPYKQIRKMTFDGAWSSISPVTSNTTANAQDPSSMSSTSMIGWIYKDTQVNAVQFDKILLNAPPTAPTNLTRSNYDATQSADLTWTFNDGDSGDSQSAYELEYQENVAGSTVIATGIIASTVSKHTITANTLVNGKEYKWRVRTYDSQSAVSPWSDYATFKCSSVPSATVTDPTASATLNGSTYTFKGSYSQAQAVLQKSFRFILWDSAGTTIVQDSGTIIGSTNAKTFESLANTTTYQIQLEVTSQDDIVGQSAKVLFSTSFVTPQIPSVSLAQDSINATVTVSVTNPAPGVGDPTVTTNEIYRRKSGDTEWMKIGESLTTFTDYQCPTGNYEYSAIAVGNNGTKSDRSNSVAINVIYSGWWIVDMDTNETFNFVYNVPLSQISLEEERQEVRTFSSKPFVRYGSFKAERGQLAGLNSGQDVREQVSMLQMLIARRKPFFLKSNRGDSWIINLYNLKRQYSIGLTESPSVEWVEVQ